MIPKDFLKPLLATARGMRAPVYLVGGAVRESFLPAKIRSQLWQGALDFDLALPKNAKGFAAKFSRLIEGRLVVLNDQRQLFRVVKTRHDKNFQFDFANFHGKTIEEDIASRDFTVDAIAISLKSPTQPIDPHRGRLDLKKKIIRAINEKNLKADPLRLLRAYRLSAAYGFTIEPQTALWIKKHVKKIWRTSPERIRFELMQIMASSRAAGALRRMDETRVLTALFPALERSRNLARVYYPKGGVLGHAIDSVGCFEENLKTIRRWAPQIHSQLEGYLHDRLSGGFPRYATLKLITLLHDIAKPHCAKKIKGRLRFFGHDEKGAKLFSAVGKKLRFSNEEISLGAKIIKAHLRPGNLSEGPVITDRAIYRFFRDLGPDGIGVLLVALADHQSYIEPSKRWSLKEPSVRAIHVLLHRYYRQRQKISPIKLINGHDVMKTLKISPGPEVGKIIEEVYAAQIENKITTRSEALSYLKKVHGARAPVAS